MPNQYVNKVVYGNSTLVDLTADTITASDLLNGVTAHDKTGAPIVGTLSSGGSGVNVATYPQSFPIPSINKTVGVLTSTESSATYVQGMAPDNANVGDIWIKTNENGVVFDIDDDGKFKIGIYSAYQYDGTEWIQREARIGDGSAWGDILNYEILYNGVCGSGLSWNWNQKNSGTAYRSQVKVDGVNVYQIKNRTQIDGYCYVAVGPIDITNFSYIYANFSAQGTPYNPYARIFLSHVSTGEAIAIEGVTYNTGNNEIAGSENKNVALDVKSARGVVFIHAGLWYGSYNGSRTLYLNKIWGI